MSQKPKKKPEDDIPKGWDSYSDPNELHAIPPDDIFEHDFSYDCYCRPRLVNKFQASQETEKLVYIHNFMATVVN